MAGQTRIADPFHLRMVFKELRHGKAVRAVAFHAQPQRAEREVEQIGVKGRGTAAEIAQDRGVELRGQRRLAETLRKDDIVIGPVRLRQLGELIGIGGPVKIAAVDDGAADEVAVARDILRRRMDDDVRAPLDRAAKRRRRECVVDDERHPLAAGDARKRLQRRDVHHRIADDFGDNAAGPVIDGLLHLAGMVAVDEDRLHAEAREDVLQQRQRASVDLA